MRGQVNRVKILQDKQRIALGQINEATIKKLNAKAAAITAGILFDKEKDLTHIMGNDPHIFVRIAMKLDEPEHNPHLKDRLAVARRRELAESTVDVTPPKDKGGDE